MSDTPEPSPMPIRCAADAMRLLRMVVPFPLEPATMGFALDDDGIGGILHLCTSVEHPDILLHAVGYVATKAAGTSATSMVLATVRPGSEGKIPTTDLLPGDVDRWLEASAICDALGMRLIEWFVIGHAGFQCPRDLLGEPARWRA